MQVVIAWHSFGMWFGKVTAANFPNVLVQAAAGVNSAFVAHSGHKTLGYSKSVLIASR